MKARYSYRALNHGSRTGFFGSLLACFRCHKITLRDVPASVFADRVPRFVAACDRYVAVGDYYKVQEAVHGLFSAGLTDSAYHEDYNNYLTFIVVCFFNMLCLPHDESRIGRAPSTETKCSFVNHLVRFHLEDDETVCVYDNYAHDTVFWV